MFTKKSSPSENLPIIPEVVGDSVSENVVVDTDNSFSEKTSQEMKVSIDENQESSSLRTSSSSAFTTPKSYQKGKEEVAAEAEVLNAGDQDLKQEAIISEVVVHSDEKEQEVEDKAEALNAGDQDLEQEAIISEFVADSDKKEEGGAGEAEAEALNSGDQDLEQEDEESDADDSRISGYSAEQDINQEIMTEEDVSKITAQGDAGELDDPNITHIEDDYSQNPLIKLYDSGVFAANSMKLLLWASLPIAAENDVLEDAEQNIVPAESQETSQSLVQGNNAILTPVKVYSNIDNDITNEGTPEDLPALVEITESSKVVINLEKSDFETRESIVIPSASGDNGAQDLLPLSDDVQMSGERESIPKNNLKFTVVPSLKNVLDNPQVKFTLGMVGGEMILNPGLGYAIDKINGVNQDKNLVDYYTQNFNGYGAFLFKAGVMFTTATVMLPISPNYGVNMLVGKVVADGAYNAVMGDKQQLFNMASVEYLQSLSWLAAPAVTSVLSPYLTSFITNKVPAQAELCFKDLSDAVNKSFNEYAVIGGLVVASGPKAADLASSILNKAVENAPKAFEFVGELKHQAYEYIFHNNEGEL